MKEIKKVMFEYRGIVIRSFFMIFGLTVFGTIIHDLIVRFVPDDEMTLFPLGTFLCIFAIVATAVFVFSTEMMVHFNMAISYGGTRKKFAVETTIFGISFYSICAVFLWSFNRFEMWKMEKLFHNMYEVESDLTAFLGFRLLAFCVLFLTALSMIMFACMLKFGMKAYFGVFVIYMVVPVFISKFEDSFAKLIQMLTDLFGNSVTLVLLVFAVVGALLFIANIIIQKQQVIN